MDKLLEKAYNCYMNFITNVQYGRTNANYSLLYGATLVLKNRITDKALVECFENRLNCPPIYQINATVAPSNIVAWALDSSLTTLPSFVWNEVTADSQNTYFFTTTPKDGFNFLFISIPQGTKLKIHNAFDIILFDSERPSSDDDQMFKLIGTSVTSNGSINNVFRKNDVFNSHNPTFFKLKLM